MSKYDYEESRELSHDAPFYALIMAAMRKADSSNLERLKGAFPEVWHEFYGRYNAPNGMLIGETEYIDDVLHIRGTDGQIWPLDVWMKRTSEKVDE